MNDKPKPLKGFLQKRGPKGNTFPFDGWRLIGGWVGRMVSLVWSGKWRKDKMIKKGGEKKKGLVWANALGFIYPSFWGLALITILYKSAHHGWKRRWFVLDENKASVPSLFLVYVNSQRPPPLL